MMTTKRMSLSDIVFPPYCLEPYGFVLSGSYVQFFDDVQLAHGEAVDLDLAEPRFADFEPADGERADRQGADRERPDGECSKCDLPGSERPYRRCSGG